MQLTLLLPRVQGSDGQETLNVAQQRLEAVLLRLLLGRCGRLLRGRGHRCVRRRGVGVRHMLQVMAAAARRLAQTCRRRNRLRLVHRVIGPLSPLKPELLTGFCCSSLWLLRLSASSSSSSVLSSVAATASLFPFFV